MRINKYISSTGYCSRREADRLIDEKKVLLNGKIADKGENVTEFDEVLIDGKKIFAEEKKVYFILNKPVGYTTTLKDIFAEKLVIDLIKSVKERIYPVGRLDKDSSGLLLLTNDGDLTFRLTHPKHNVEKEYIVVLDREVLKKDLKILSNGVVIDGVRTRKAKFIYAFDTKNTIRVFLKEGRNRQIRKMFKSLNYSVISLNRISFGKINLKNLEVGEYRELTESEVKYLRSIE